MTATDELRRLLDERGVEHEDMHTELASDISGWDSTWWRGIAGMEFQAVGDETYGREGCVYINGIYLTPEQAIAATLGTPISADLRTALDFMRIWITDDAHLGESAISYEFEKAEGLRKLDAIEQAIAATLGNGEPPYDELLRCLENGWHIRASWDGLRRFWNIELTEEGVRLRDDELNARAERTCEGTRWHELFGTPERAARTLHELCGGCCGLPEQVRGDYDALLEWLRGDA